MTFPGPLPPLTWRAQAKWSLTAIVSFHLAHEYASCAPFIGLFFLSVLQLSRAASAWTAWCFGWGAGLCIYGPQLFFFWSIFGRGAIFLWLVLGTWLALYLLLQRFAFRRFGRVRGAFCAPLLWTGLEYFRSELYPLRFSWLNAGYLSPPLSHWTGMYGAGFILMCVAVLVFLGETSPGWRYAAAICGAVVITAFLPFDARPANTPPQLPVAGVQFEEGSDPAILAALDDLYTRYPGTSLFVLSEYSFGTPVPPEIRAWCARRKRWLIAGGKEFIDAAHSQYRNTAFVIGPDGDEIYQQAKSRPIQFFDDGLPAVRQSVWDSPWGKIGLCICYDLSYTRVTDALIRQGAQAIIVPTMDVVEWGAREHVLHARVAPTRAAEYGVPIFRLCSSGVSQAVASDGRVLASAPFPGQGQTLAATLALPVNGGHLPIDRLLAWPCVAFAAFLLGWQLVAGVLSGVVRPQ